MHLREGDDAGSGVSLQYLDEYGRPMTQKEAWRRINYNFHGIAPGRKRVEKRMKQYEEERRIQAAAASDTPLHMVGTASRVQEALQQPYVVLSGANAVGKDVIARSAGHARDPDAGRPRGKRKGKRGRDA